MPVPFLYVDDTTLFDKVKMNRAVRLITTNTTEEEFLSLPVGGDFGEQGR